MTTWVPRSTMLFVFLSVAAVLLLGCPSSLMGRPRAAGKPVRVRLGQEFNLRVGQQAVVEGGAFQGQVRLGGERLTVPRGRDLRVGRQCRGADRGRG